ncbi:MAG: universal stress protein E [Rhodothermales bacterium]|jgi:universal stress protein E
MQRFRKILLVLDSHETSQWALLEGMRVARRNGARLHVIQVIPDFSDSLLAATSADLAPIQKQVCEATQHKLHTLIQEMGPGKLEVSVGILTGIPFFEIIREVIRSEHDLVIKPAAPRVGPGGKMLSSVDLHLLRKCPCPVWLQCPDAMKACRRRVMAAVNVMRDTELTHKMNQQILELAASQAARDRVDLDIVAVWSLPNELLLQAIPESAVSVETLRQDAEAVCRSRFERATAAASGTTDVTVRTHLLQGTAALVLEEFVCAQQIGLVVMGTVARTDLPGLLIGDTAETILATAACSMMAIKPLGFESPVQL